MHRIRRCYALALIIISLPLAGYCGDIHDAVISGDIDRVRDLITADTSLVNKPDERGMTPLRLAVHTGDNEITGLLLDRGAGTDEIHPVFGSIVNQAFAAACQRNTGPELVEFLMERGLVLEAGKPDGMGMTPLDWAANFGNLSMARLALDHGADVNAVSRRMGRPPLVLAVSKGKEELVDLLLDHNADVSVTDSDNKPAILYAVDKGRTSILGKLLAHGATAGFVEPNRGQSLIHLAAIRGFRDIAEALVTHGADIKATDKSGHTPLYYAARYGNRNVADFLVGEGAARPQNLIENYRNSPWLTDNIDADQASIWYLNHRGWAVRTKEHLLVFDAEEFEVRRSDNPCLANGFLTAGELRDQNITAAYSCYHGLPGEPSYIHVLADSVDHINFLHLSDDPWRGSPNTAYLKAQADTIIGDIAVRTIDILENMPALGYMLKVDELSIYYQAFNSDNSEKLRQDFESLSKSTDTVDIAFLPLPEPGSEEESDLRLFLNHFPTRVICLLDSGRREYLFPLAAQKIIDWNYPTEVFCAENPGDHFRRRLPAK